MAILDDVRETAKRLGVDPDLAAAIAEQESGGNPQAVSPKGARGVMQVMPGTAQEMRAAGYRGGNIEEGLGYFKKQMETLGTLPPDRQRQHALAAYNAGPGALAKARARAKAQGLDDTDFGIVSRFLPKETQDYVPGVLGRVRSGGATATFDPSQVDIQPLQPGDLLAELGDTPQATMTPTSADLQPGDLLAEADSDAGRGFAGSLYERTVGRVPGMLDRALGGAPSALAGYAGAKSAGDEAGAQRALEEGGGTNKRLLNVLLGLLEGGLTAQFPGSAALGAGAGAGLEAATGSRAAGDVAEVATGLAAPVAKLGRAALGGERTAARVASDLGAGTTTREAGELLQAPGKGARRAIKETAEEGSRLYGEAQAGAKAAGAALPAGDTALRDAVKAADKELKGLATQLPGGVRRVLAQLKRSGRGTKSKLVTAQGKPASVGRTRVGVDELIEMQSNLRREVRKLPRDHVARQAMKDVDAALEDAIGRGAAGTPAKGKVEAARKYYGETVIPTRKSAARVASAETPEQAARMARQPTRFERISAAAPESAEPVRSSFFNEMIETSSKEGGFDVGKLSTKLSSNAEKTKAFANTPARRQAIAAIHTVAKGQNAAGRLPFIGPLVKAALRSERAGRVLYRLAHAKAGSPGWKLAVKAAKRITASEPVGAAARVAGDQEE